MELLRSKAGERSVRLDPRTKMVMLFAVSTVLLLGETRRDVRRAHGDAAVPFGLLAISGRACGRAHLSRRISGPYALAAFAAPTLEGIANAITVATATVVSASCPPLHSHISYSPRRRYPSSWRQWGACAFPTGLSFRCRCCSGSFPRLARKRGRSTCHADANITPISRGASYVENCLVHS